VWYAYNTVFGSTSVSYTESKSQGNDEFEIDFNGETETRHLVEGSFGSEFPAICSHCRVMAAGSLKTPKNAVK